MSCRIFPIFSFEAPTQFATLIRVYNIAIALLNITGNSLLIWGLKKTGQYKTISFQFIIVMSTSDLIAGVESLVMLTLATWEEYNKICWIRLSTQSIMATCNCFSFVMILLIALDRYLHMKYLEKYFTVFTKKRGYFLVVASLLFIAVMCFMFTLPLPYQFLRYFQYSCVLFGVPVMFGIGMLYYSAMNAIKAKASQLTRSVLTQTKIISKAAKRVTMCAVILSLPFLTIQILKFTNENQRLIDASLLNSFYWLTYITFLSTGFFSSIIFMSQNRPLGILLRQTVQSLFTYVNSAIGPTA